MNITNSQPLFHLEVRRKWYSRIQSCDMVFTSQEIRGDKLMYITELILIRLTSAKVKPNSVN